MSNDTQHDGAAGGDSFITAAITRHALARGTQAAMSFGSQNLTYAELESLVQTTARWLHERVSFGAKLSLCLPHSPALAVLFLGGVRAGCEVHVFDRQWPDETVTELLDELAPALLISDRRIAHRSTQVVLPARNATLSEVQTFVTDASARLNVRLPSAGMPFYVGFTSGSTGPPKGFRRDHRSWLCSFEQDNLECPLDIHDVVAAPGDLTHSLFLYAMMRTLHAGAHLVLCRRFSRRAVAHAVERHRASVLYTVPVHIGELCKSSPQSFATLHRMLSSGAKLTGALRERVREKFHHVELCEFYGASELSFVTISKSSESIPATSVGRAFAGVELSIRNELGAKLPARSVGRVFVESEMTFLGYTRATDEPARFGSAISVGDLGYVDEDGCLFLQGRADRMIVSAGKNVYPEEVERVLQSHPVVQSAAVIGVADDKRGKRLVAIVQFAGKRSLCRAALISHCRASLPSYKVPRIFGICAQWRYTHSKKTDFAAIACAWNSLDIAELK